MNSLSDEDEVLIEEAITERMNLNDKRASLKYELSQTIKDIAQLRNGSLARKFECSAIEIEKIYKRVLYTRQKQLRARKAA